MAKSCIKDYLMVAGIWAALKQLIHLKFPQVRSISTAELAAWLQTEDRPPPILLDTRTAEEFAVSHLHQAQQIDLDQTDFTEWAHIPRDAAIITYCSVGYRSAAICDRLQKAEFTNVANLEGSIFAWANEGHPVYRGDQIVQAVHPYSQLWSHLLHENLRA